jgi:bisanhydrobacterioruberin hydratase
VEKNISFYWSRYKDWILISVLIIFHTVGYFGIRSTEYHDTFLKLSFFNLLLSFTILLFSRKTKTGMFILFLVLCFMIGLIVEWIGIHTSLLFGEYEYGENLGVKIAGVPVIIGVNWGLLTVSSCSLFYYFNIPIWLKTILSAGAMTLLDFFIEPVAIQSDYWTWKTPEIPAFNYICWFLIAIPLHYIYYKSDLIEKNNVGVALYVIMSVFFLLLG